MAKFTSEEYVDMHFVYGECVGNAPAAVRRYAERFPQRRIPHRETFIAVAQRLRETGSVFPRPREAGRGRQVHVLDAEVEILNSVENDASVSTREIAREVGVSHWTVWRTLHENLLYPYHLQRVHSLEEYDYAPRINFCRWLLQQTAQNPEFLSKLLMTDECCFTRDGILNFHNTHVWADANPHEVHQKKFQRRFSINVWAGIVGNFLIGPFVLPDRLNGEHYLQFLRDYLPDLLDNVPLATRQNMWFMHDGAPAHFSRNVRDHLDIIYPNRWIGRNGPIAWPARTPDLNSCDFFLWGHMKSVVYRTPVINAADLQQRIMTVADSIRNDVEILASVRGSLMRRARACIRADGAHFEQFL